MEITMPLIDILNINQVLMSKIESCKNNSLKFKFLTILHQIGATVQNCEHVRHDIIKKYGNENEDGSYSIEKNSEGMMKFVEEYDTFLSDEITLHIDKIKFEDIADYGLNELQILYLLIEE